MINKAFLIFFLLVSFLFAEDLELNYLTKELLRH